MGEVPRPESARDVDRSVTTSRTRTPGGRFVDATVAGERNDGGATFKYVRNVGIRDHDPNRHEEQTDTARGGPPSVLRAKALVFCALEDWRGMV